MRKRILTLALSMAMLLGLAWQSASAAGGAGPGNRAYHWFYDQLGPQAQKIYDALENAYENDVLKSGTAEIPLDMDAAAAAYMKGNRTLFSDFSAAKDAFDLEHPEAWYFDSSELSLTVRGDASAAKASMDVGKSDSYLVMGANDGEGLAAKDKALGDAVAAIVKAAGSKGGTYEKIKYVHDEVVGGISYRYETECQKGNGGFIRTAGALITHEGVCEGYVRSFQMILNELGIPCVPIHGTQTSGVPEAHMWCAVYIDDEKGAGWYAVDPTWDDPVVLSGAKAASGNASRKGTDGGERHDYFMVGNDVIGSDWIPSGYVSTGTMEFAYPGIAPRSYGAGQIGSNGLVVTYDDGMMESTASTVYHISYEGKGLYQSSLDGKYFLLKMYDLNADGSVDAISQWYYPAHMLHALGPNADSFDPNDNFKNTGNKYLYDTDGYLVESVSNCEYVEFAVTTVSPPAWKKADDLITMGGFFSGSENDIIAQTGLIYNPNGGYEQRPWAKNVSPGQNMSTYVGATYTIHMEFTDPLFHPDAASIAVSEALGKVNEAKTAMKEKVGLDYAGTNYSWGVNGGLPHQFAVKPEPQNVRWYCTEHDAVHTDMARIEAYGSACRLTTLEFEFTPSVMWADDSVSYEFYLTGLVGAKSNKKPGGQGMAFVFENQSAFCAYRCVKKGGIDWNLWGQPQLLDDPNNLDFDELKVKGIDDKAAQSIKELYGNMNLDSYDMNGRLLLVVEDAGADRDRAGELSEILKDPKNDVGGVDLQSAVASALYEIDFARVCGKTVVETGQSLRMQVGFPAGFDAGKLDTTVFKVYHFKKDAAGNITGVEEIPVTVTPYGLVFQVSSFSPFAIVAEEGKADNSRGAVLVSDGHGTIEAVGYQPKKVDKEGKSAEVKGTLTLLPGESCSIEITPDKGYRVESITATGFTGSYGISGSGGAFTLSYNDIGTSNAMIGVTFAPAEKAPETVEVLSLCSHENRTKKEGSGKAATCTEDGYYPTLVCPDCGQVVSEGEVIRAAGHDYGNLSGYRQPTCTENGTRLTCKSCGVTSQAVALGHDYSDGVCIRDGCGAKEQYTVTFDPNGGKIVSGLSARTLDAGTTLTSDMLPAVERSGYKFAGWRTAKDRDDPEGEGVDPNDPKKPLQLTRSIVLYAAWDESAPARACVITVTASPSGGGTVSGGGNYKAGDTVTLTAAPASGYSFSGWTEGGRAVSGSGTYSFTAGSDRTLTAVFTRGGTGNSGTTTETETAGDGTETTTVTDSKTGSSTVTVKNPDGSVSVTETDASGNVSRWETFADGVEVLTRIPVGDSVSASILIPAGRASATVTIHAPVTAGTVAVNRANGRIVMLSVPVEDGLKVVLDGSAEIVLVDRSTDFDDMPGSHWAAASVGFVTAHGLFNGMGDGKFNPDANMTRTMLMTVLARFSGVDTSSGATWDGPGMEWAVANGISDGTNPNADITREQLAAMLYRYAGSPGTDGAGGGVSGYSDAGEISDWASAAMRWAVQKGIIQGSNGRLNPGSKALRSEVSAMIERFCRNVSAL